MASFGDNISNIKTYSMFIANTNGQSLFCKYWEPLVKARAIVFIAHGYAEHCLMYSPLARVLASNNFFVFAHDHVGHGQSEGIRAHIDTFNKYIEDVFHHIDLTRARYPDLDCFICGHSMGGAISIIAALKRPDYFKGVLLIAPAIVTNPALTTPFKVRLAKIMRRIVPQFPVATLDVSKMCRCPKKVKIMKNDPLRYHGFCKAGFGASLMEACKAIQRRVRSIRFPFIIFQGEDDKICGPEGAALMYEDAASKDKTIQVYPDAYHSLLNEPNGVAETVAEEIVKWLCARS